MISLAITSCPKASSVKMSMPQGLLLNAPRRMACCSVRELDEKTRVRTATSRKLLGSVEHNSYLARSTARGLAAMAVMNMAEEMVDVWKAVFMTYAPAPTGIS